MKLTSFERLCCFRRLTLSLLAWFRASSMDSSPFFTRFMILSCISLLNWEHQMFRTFIHLSQNQTCFPLFFFFQLSIKKHIDSQMMGNTLGIYAKFLEYKLTFHHAVTGTHNLPLCHCHSCESVKQPVWGSTDIREEKFIWGSKRCTYNPNESLLRRPDVTESDSAVFPGIKPPETLLLLISRSNRLFIKVGLHSVC